MISGLHYSQEVFRQLRLLEVIIDSLSEGVAVGHREAGLVLFNSAARGILGHSLTDSPREKWSEHYGIYLPDGATLLPEEDLPMVQALKGNSVRNCEMFIRNEVLPNGKIIVADAHPIPPHLGVVVFRDITAERRTAQALLEAKEMAEQASHAKTAFLANMSHEIRTPLGAILGFSEMLSEHHAIEGEGQAWLDSIHRNAKHLFSLVDGVLDLSKIEVGQFALQPRWLEFEPCFNNALESLRVQATTKGLEFIISVNGIMPEYVWLDDVAFRRILINIIGNAIKFTDTGFIKVSVTRDGDFLQISMQDSGIGLTPEALQKIFRPFSQGDSSMSRRYGGTGLGLVVSEKLAKSMGGGLRLEKSAPRVGSEFVLTLRTEPEHPGEVESKPKSSPSPSQDLRSVIANRPLNGFRILVVEDNPDNQVLLKHILRRAGAEVMCADDGERGYDVARSANIDLILMDIQMPGMDGYESTRRLRGAGFYKPIIALTAHALADEKKRCLDAGCNEYLCKPVNPHLLINTLKQLGNVRREQHAL